MYEKFIALALALAVTTDVANAQPYGDPYGTDPYGDPYGILDPYGGDPYGGDPPPDPCEECPLRPSSPLSVEHLTPFVYNGDYDPFMSVQIPWPKYIIDPPDCF